MIIEISKQCGLSKKEAFKQGYCIEWTEQHIKECFKNGHGTMKDLKNYMENNKQYCWFIEQ